MSLFDLTRLLYRNLKPLVLFPLLLAVVVIILTANQPKEYATSALIYTGIASGYNIEKGSSDKVDYHAVNNAFDNLISIVKSRQTLEEVALQLLATLLVQSSFEIDRDVFNPNEYTIPSTLSRNVAIDSLYLDLKMAYQREELWIVDIVRNSNGPVGIPTLSSIETKRHRSSDMLVIYYKSNDPVISKITLDILIRVFADRYRRVKESETGDVVKYFERQLAEARLNLDQAESKLTTFRSENQVINYGEQTKAIAIKKQNALEEYSQRKMNLLASEAALLEIEDKLKMRDILLEKNADLLNKRNELMELTHSLAYMQSSEKWSDPDEIVQINSRIEELKIEIQESLEIIFRARNSKEGLPSPRLLHEWLENLITINREKAIVEYYQNRINELDAMYERFAPLGSTLARLEREIGVFEQEYLEILNSLNQSKLRQQNIQMSSQLEVIDQPILPSKPLGSKRLLLVVIGFMGGFVLVLCLIIAAEMMDTTLKTPRNAAMQTGLKVIGAFPGTKNIPRLDRNKLIEQLADIAIGKLDLPDSRKNPIVVSVASMYGNEGKHFVSQELSGALQRYGFNTHSISLENHEHGPLNTLDEVQKQIGEQCPDESPDVIILIHPPLSKGYVKTNLLKSSYKTLFVARADKTWTMPQEETISEWKEILKEPPVLLLNGVQFHLLDQIVGEIPVQRNSIVNRARELAKLQLSKSAFNLF